MEVSYHLRDEQGNIAVVAYLVPDFRQEGRWDLNRIAVMRGTPKGRGWGTDLLKVICAEADKEGCELVLGVSPDDPLAFRRLVRWYQKHGFTRWGRGKITPYHNLMIRYPRKAEETW